MTKEQLYVKWLMTPDLKSDLEAVIANELAMAKVKPQPELNPIEEAYERGEKIRMKNWLKKDWIQKHNETKTIDNNMFINSVFTFGFIQHPQLWELYTETAEQPAPKEDSAIFFVHLESKDQKFHRMEERIKNTSANDFFDWLLIQQDKIKKEQSCETVIVNCNIIKN